MDNTAGVGGKMGDIERARLNRLRERVAILRDRTKPRDADLFLDVRGSSQVPVRELIPVDATRKLNTDVQVEVSTLRSSES